MDDSSPQNSSTASRRQIGMAAAELSVKLNGKVDSPTSSATVFDDFKLKVHRDFVIPCTLTSGVIELLDCRCSAFISIVDAVAALSCEALRANVSFSGDGLSKDTICVAADFNVWLKDSKLVNSGELVNPDFSEIAVAEIASAHGTFREVSRLLHSKTTSLLDSGLRDVSAKDMAITALVPLALSLSCLGCKSLVRSNILISDSISDVQLKHRLLSETSSLQLKLLSCRTQILLDICLQEHPNADDDLYLLFLEKIYNFLYLVWNIVSWEAIAAFVSIQKIVSPQESDKAEKSGDKKKKNKEKKKVVLGKGTAALMQYFIEEKLLCGAANFDVEKLALDFRSLLDPEGTEFYGVITKVKEIVESKEKLLKTPKGTHDFAGKQKAIRDKAFATILKVFKRHGGTGLDTPVFELRDTLKKKYGEDSNNLIFDLADQGGELCSLRYDHTVPFARYTAMNGLTKFRRYQIGPVYRRDNATRGRYREFYQCDFDIAGNSAKMEADFEVIYMLTELLDELYIGDYEVKINHKKLLDGMLAICGVPEDKFSTICSSIDKLDKKSFEEVKSEMVKKKGLAEKTADKIRKFVEHKGPPMEMLSQLKQEGGELLSNSEAVIALNELEILFGFLLKSKSNGMNKIVLDMSLARGLDYYTGVIFEVVDKADSKIGSIAAGGRYDNIIGMFGTKQVPSIGLSLGFERVFLIMEELQQERNQAVRATETHVLVSILGNNSTLAIEIVSELWATKLINAEFKTDKRMDKLIDHAMESQIPFMVTVTDDELSQGVVKLKNMKDKSWEHVPRSQLVPELLKRLNLV